MNHSAFGPLLLLTLLAVLVPVVVNHFRAARLPIVVGEILAGIVIGRSGLVVSPISWLMSVVGKVGRRHHHVAGSSVPDDNRRL